MAPNKISQAPNAIVVHDNTSILFLVGKNESPFFITFGDIKHRSSYLVSRLTDSWKNNKEQHVKLRDLDATSFGRYIYWVFSRKMAQDDYATLATLYVLGHKLCDGEFQDHIMLTLMELTKQTVCPPLSAVNAFYVSTYPHSPVRKYLVDMYVACGLSGLFRTFPGEPDHEFMNDLAMAFMDESQQPREGTRSAQRLKERSDVYFKNPGAGKVKSENHDR